MARVTIEDCLKRVPNRFILVHLAVQRVKQLREGAPPLVECDNKEVVQALREIAAGLVYPVTKEEAERQRAEAEEMERARLAEAAAALEAAARAAQEAEASSGQTQKEGGPQG